MPVRLTATEAMSFSLFMTLASFLPHIHELDAPREGVLSITFCLSEPCRSRCTVPDVEEAKID